MNSQLRFFVAFLLLSFGIGVATASPITPEAQRLQAALDASNVEKLWPAGSHVDWRSGEPDGRQVATTGKHTHCSAFVASTAEKLGVYILRPPEHSPVLLANAQSDWLDDHGDKSGWQPVTGELAAQAEANKGRLVVAVYRNHHDDRPGHIAIIRPSDKSDAEIQQEGPQVTQAGLTNYLSTSLQQGFVGHPAAWGKHEVRYYAHAVDWNRLPN